MKDNRSFFEKLTGSMRMDDGPETSLPESKSNGKAKSATGEAWFDEEGSEGELTVDVYQTPSEIVIKSMVAGVKPEDLDISITRDMVVIKGKRETERFVKDEDYFHQECYWGTFSRSVILPLEVDSENSVASFKNGILTIRLPKIEKVKTKKIKIAG